MSFHHSQSKTLHHQQQQSRRAGNPRLLGNEEQSAPDQPATGSSSAIVPRQILLLSEDSVLKGFLRSPLINTDLGSTPNIHLPSIHHKSHPKPKVGIRDRVPISGDGAEGPGPGAFSDVLTWSSGTLHWQIFMDHIWNQQD